MKILAVCQGGNSRSVAMARVLKTYYHHDALSSGYRDNSPETMKMLYEWSELIILMAEKYMEHVPEEYRHKVRVCDLPTDRWAGPPKELQEICRNSWRVIRGTLK
jgi:hypothetical protein